MIVKSTLLFLSGVLIYLLAIPILMQGFDPVIGVRFNMDARYFLLVCVYFFFTILGFYAAIKVKRNFITSIELNESRLNLLFFLGLIGPVYNVITGDILAGRGLLFLIITYDFLLVYFALAKRKNVFVFLIILFLYLHAGFRYRIVVLLILFLIPRDRQIGLRDLVKLTIMMSLPILVLLNWGQNRVHGELSGFFKGLGQSEIRTILVSSGEQTVSSSTVIIVNQIDNIPKAGLSPFGVLLTHWIPSAIWNKKPRVRYLSDWLVVAPRYKGTGVAFHEFAELLLFGGVLMLPVFSFFFGYVKARLFREINSCGLGSSYSLVVLFAIFLFILVPMRGYIVQQVTWVFQLLLPLAFVGRLRLIRGKR